MNGRRKLDVQAFIDAQSFSRFHFVLLAQCFLIALLDGMDIVAMGYIAPALIEDWGVSRASLGPALSATLVGIAIGALVVSPVADRIGRKPVLIGSVLVFGVFNAAAAFAQSLEMMAAMRLLTGIGLGTAVPNVVTLMAEYAPARIRGALANTMMVGFSVGSVLGGLLTAWLIPQLGWRSVLIIGGVAPLVLVLILVPLLPESVKFLVASGKTREKALSILHRIAPGTRLDDADLMCAEARSQGRQSPIRALFSRRYARGTCMLWLCYIMCMLIIYLVGNWLPTLFTASGYSLRESAIGLALFHVGGCIGILTCGFLADRFPAARVVGAYFAVAAVTMLVIGQDISQGSLTVLIVLLGMTVSGASGSMPPLAANYYPTTSRVTGVAWMLGVGRFGGVAGTMGGALLLGSGWALGSIFSLLAIPAALSVLSLVVLSRSEAPQDETDCLASSVVDH